MFPRFYNHNDNSKLLHGIGSYQNDWSEDLQMHGRSHFN